jgi:hypothetical protein
MAKKARAALKEKAKRLGSDRPTEKVDSSTWSPPELLNADVKTGLRPISRRAYKSGGKVEGACAPTRADRKQRKSGGEATAYANAKVNRNVKDANELREGKKHIGGMKKGGRAGKDEGGGLYEGNRRVVSPAATRAEPKPKSSAPQNAPLPPRRPADLPRDEGMSAEDAQRFMHSRKRGGRTKKAIGGAFGQYLSPALMLANAIRGDRDKDEKKRGGRAKKMDGGLAGDPRTAGNAILQNSAAAAGVPQDRLGFAPNMPSQGVKRFLGLKKGGKAEDYKSLRAKGGTQVMSSAMKKGGEAKHPDEAMDKALIKKMVKPSARTGKADGGDAIMGKRTDKPENVYKPEYNEQSVDKAIDSSNRAGRKIRGKEAMMIKGLLKGRTGRATGGGTFSGPGYPEKVPGVTGGRKAKAVGGQSLGAVSQARPASASTPLPTNQYSSTTRQYTPAQNQQRAVARRDARMANEAAHQAAFDARQARRVATDAAKVERPENTTRPAKKGGRIKKFAGGALGYAMGGMPSRGGSPAPGMMGRPSAPMPQMGRPMQRPLPGANPLTPTYPTPQQPVTGGPLPPYQPEVPVTGGPLPMYNKGGRVAYKKGGKVRKGKTNINIVIQAGKPDTGGMDVKNPMMAGPVPPPPAPPIMPPPDAGAPPPGMPPMPPGGAPGMPPMMGRKAGGRVYRSYKDMDAGAGSGLGRLEKTEIASRSNRKAGGKVYRSYKDMDAGAGSGLGRLEKTEIQRRK